MKKDSLFRAAALSTVIAGAGIATAQPIAPIAKASPPVLDGITYGGGAQLDGRKVVVKGAVVDIDLGATSSKGATRFDLALAHVDNGAHSFHISYGPLLALGFQCNGRDLKITASFGGAKTFAAEITKAGQTSTMPNLAGVLELKGYDTAHTGAQELVTFRFAYGLVRADVFSLVIEHEDQKIVLTPDGAGPSALPGRLSVGSTGLAGFTIVEPKFQIIDAATFKGALRNGSPAPARNGIPERNGVPAAARNGAPAPLRNGVPSPARNGAPQP